MYLGDFLSPHSGVRESFLPVKPQILPSFSRMGIINLPEKIGKNSPVFSLLRNKPDFSMTNREIFFTIRNSIRALGLVGANPIWNRCAVRRLNLRSSSQ